MVRSACHPRVRILPRVLRVASAHTPSFFGPITRRIASLLSSITEVRISAKLSPFTGAYLYGQPMDKSTGVLLDRPMSSLACDRENVLSLGITGIGMNAQRSFAIPRRFCERRQ